MIEEELFMLLSSATITGRHHRLMQQNGHDYAITGRSSPEFAFGLVLDGCGSQWEKKRLKSVAIYPPKTRWGLN
jgi:hypothetical protein